VATRSEKRELSAKALLRAAERVFAEKSYFGATVRDIADEAGLNLSLISYHFGGKEALFAKVIEDRLPQLIQDLETALSSSKADNSAQALIGAFADAMLDKCTDFESGWGYYIQLISRSMSPYHIPQLRPALTALTTVGEVLLDALAELDQRGNEFQRQLGVYFIESAITYIVQDEWVLSARASALPTCTARSPQLREGLVTFLSAGYKAMTSAKPPL